MTARPVTRLPDSARWIWVALPSATFAIAVKDGRVVAAPPYAWKIINGLGSDEERAVAGHLLKLGTRKQPTMFAELPMPCRAWVELAADSGWGAVRTVRAALARLGYVTAELRGTGNVLLRLSGVKLERGELLRMPGG